MAGLPDNAWGRSLPSKGAKPITINTKRFDYKGPCERRRDRPRLRVEAPTQIVRRPDQPMYVFAEARAGYQRVRCPGPVDTEENMVGNYDTVLETALLPGQIATAQWNHLVEEPGNYLVQFGVWERLHDGLVFRAPCPMERLIVAHPPGMPLVDVVGLEVPTRGPGDQWITITGENFEPHSAVILKFIATEYPIDAERVKYENPNTIKVWESFTVAGTWQVQVVNSADESSNWLDFRVLP